MPPSYVNNHPGDSEKINYWSIRAHRPGAMTSPGMPCAEDLRPFAKYAPHLRQAQNTSEKQGLVVGATRQTVDWCRENGLRIAMMDFSEPFAQIIQSAHHDWEDLHIIIDDWLSSKEEDGSFCWAAGDCIIAASGSGREAVRLFQQIRRLLIPGSLVILRNFIRPHPTPTGAEIFARLEAGGFGSFSAFRIQLLQSLQRSFMEGVPTREACQLLARRGVLDKSHMERFSWSPAQLKALDSWEVEGVTLCYPTLDELRELARPYFEELEIGYGDYEMAELCPTMVYRTRG